MQWIQASVMFLESFGVKNLNSVQEMTVNLTKKKVLDLLKCSLLAKSTLPDLFRVKKSLLPKSKFFSTCC